jgi:hypothetical protein
MVKQSPKNAGGKRDIVLFLGAGFSSDAKLPTMAEFGRESEDARNRLLKYKGNRDAFGLYARAYEGFKKAQDILRRAQAHVKLDVDNMQTIFCMAEAMRESNIRKISNQRRTDIKRWLWKIYQQCPLAQQRKGSLGVPYAELINILRRGGYLARTTVLTTNYDLVFEYAAWKQGMKCCYPFGAGTAKECRLLKRGNAFVSLTPVRESLVVCKLHGSVNYFKRDHPIKTLYVMDNLVPKDMPHREALIGKSSIPGLPEVFAFDALSELKKKGLPSIPEIIPPTYAKLARRAWLREIWNAAFKAMRNARHVIFIGYSLPQTDGFMHAMIRSAMAVRKDVLRPCIYVINPKRHKEYLRLFHKDMVSFRDFRFAEAIVNGAFESVLEECRDSA